MNQQPDDHDPVNALPPDDRVREVEETAFDAAGLSTAGFVLLKLDGYLKPPLAEELSNPLDDRGCSCNSVCACVPVQTCACDSVCSCNTVSSHQNATGGGGGGGGGYYAPCF